ITLITTNGQALRLKVKHIRQAGRATMGTRLINLKEGDTVASVARLSAKDLEPAVAAEPRNGQTAPVGQPELAVAGPNGANGPNGDDGAEPAEWIDDADEVEELDELDEADEEEEDDMDEAEDEDESAETDE